MKVWFHSIYELDDPDEGESYSYDSFTDSKLFASWVACSQDAEREYREELEASAKRYADSCRRREIAQEAMAALDAAGIDVSELHWVNYANADPPDFHDPPERFFYSLDIEEEG